MRREEQQRQQQSSNALLIKKTTTLINRYGDKNHFLAIFNPDLQAKACKFPDRCFFGDAPTLAEINITYGDTMATMWLIPQLYDLSEYCGCKDKLQGKPLEQCASVIAGEFFYLKVSELMLFFHRFKTGRYGRFYGAVDPLVITTSLRTFIEERAYEIERKEQQIRAEKERESRKTAMSYQEYLELNKICEQIEAEYYMETKWNRNND
jgi:hypothetical protein